MQETKARLSEMDPKAAQRGRLKVEVPDPRPDVPAIKAQMTKPSPREVAERLRAEGMKPESNKGVGGSSQPSPKAKIPPIPGGKDSKGAPAEAEKDTDLESDSNLPAPLNNGAYRKILEELPNGARVAAETCVKYWKEKRFPTEELVAFLKTISIHSPTLKRGFEDQHQGFLRAMKLQEEQQRQREEEEIRSMRQWQHYPPPEMMMRGGVPAPGMVPASPHWMPPYGSYPPYGHPGPGTYMGAGENFHTSEFYPPSRPPLPGQSPMPHMDSRYLHWDMQSANSHSSSPSNASSSNSLGVNNPFVQKRRQRGSADTLQKLAAAVRGGEDPAVPARVLGELKNKRVKGKEDEAAAAQDPKSSWQPSDADLEAARKSLEGFSSRKLKDHPLGNYLTRRAQAVSPSVFVKVVSDVKKEVKSQDAPPHAYRCKAILAFRCLPGSVGDALTFGMYVHEYGVDAPATHKGRVFVECIDSTPLYTGEQPEERQRSLAAIVQGYMEFIASLGYFAVMFRIPPPTDDAAHIFAPRAFDVRLRASQHVGQWYKKILETALKDAVISDFRCASEFESMGFAPSVLSSRDNAVEAQFRKFLRSGHKMASTISRIERFFLALLPRSPDPPTYGQAHACLYNKVSENRQKFLAFCSEQRLRFHTVPNAQLSTMTILGAFRNQSDTPLADDEHETNTPGGDNLPPKDNQGQLKHDQNVSHVKEEETQHAVKPDFTPPRIGGVSSPHLRPTPNGSPEGRGANGRMAVPGGHMEAPAAEGPEASGVSLMSDESLLLEEHGGDSNMLAWLHDDWN